MTEKSQQEFLKSLKDELGVTWDELALLSGIKSRALKTYRMPVDSKDFRTLNDLAKAALIRAKTDREKESKRA